MTGTHIASTRRDTFQALKQPQRIGHWKVRNGTNPLFFFACKYFCQSQALFVISSDYYCVDRNLKQFICRLNTDSASRKQETKQKHHTRLAVHIIVLDNMVSTFLVTWPSNKKIDIADQGNSSTQIGQGINWLYYSTPGRASKKISLISHQNRSCQKAS